MGLFFSNTHDKHPTATAFLIAISGMSLQSCGYDGEPDRDDRSSLSITRSPTTRPSNEQGVVALRIQRGGGILCSGVVVSKKRCVLTAAHCLFGARFRNANPQDVTMTLKDDATTTVRSEYEEALKISRRPPTPNRAHDFYEDLALLWFEDEHRQDWNPRLWTNVYPSDKTGYKLVGYGSFSKLEANVDKKRVYSDWWVGKGKGGQMDTKPSVSQGGDSGGPLFYHGKVLGINKGDGPGFDPNVLLRNGNDTWLSEEIDAFCCSDIGQSCETNDDCCSGTFCDKDSNTCGYVLDIPDCPKTSSGSLGADISFGFGTTPSFPRYTRRADAYAKAESIAMLNQTAEVQRLRQMCKAASPNAELETMPPLYMPDAASACSSKPQPIGQNRWHCTVMFQLGWRCCDYPMKSGF